MLIKRASLVGAFILAVAGLTACGGDDGGGGSASGYCAKIKDMGEAEAADVSDQEGQKLFEELQDSAPDEIKDDFETVLKAFDVETPDASDLEGMTPEEIQEQAENATDGLGDMSAALERIATYTDDQCGVELPE